VVERIAIAATYEMKPGRYPKLTPMDMYHHVLAGALSHWCVRPHDIDGLFATPAGMAMGETDIATHEKLAEALGIRPRISETLYAGGASFSIMVQRAAAIIYAGLAESILCLGAGKFKKVGAGGADIQARVASEPDFEYPYGAYIVSNYALIASQYVAAYDVPREALARVAVSARRWAIRNPQAIMFGKGEITVDDVLKSRPIASPFNLLDCSVPCDGGGAVLVTTAAKARSIAKQPAYVWGFGETHTHSSVSQAHDILNSGAIDTASEAFSQARIAPSDITVAQLYDAFSAVPLLLLENIGFCRRGEAAAMALAGALDPGGKLPTNTGGGLLSFGHTGDASGMSVLIEGVRQVMNEATGCQVEEGDRGLIHTYGGMLAEHSTLIVGREP